MTKLQFMQQKKLFIWDTHCQYKLRDQKTYTFQLFFSTENRFWIGIKKTIVFPFDTFFTYAEILKVKTCQEKGSTISLWNPYKKEVNIQNTAVRYFFLLKNIKTCNK